MITYERDRHKIEDIINIVKSEGVEIIDISTDDGDLEDVFIQLTKNQIFRSNAYNINTIGWLVC